MSRSHLHARDAALYRMRAVNRWLVAGAVVATGLLTDVAAQAFPGHTITRTAGSSAKTGRGQALPTVTHHTRHHAVHRALKPAARAPKPALIEPTAGATFTPASAAPATPTPAAPAPVVSGGS